MIHLKPHLYQNFRIPQVAELIPPAWARTGHLQTLAAHFLPSPTLENYGERTEFQLGDGDKLVGYIKEGRHPVMISVFHGLGGDLQSDYMQRTAKLASDMGFGYAIINHRGAGEGHGLARSTYHSGRGEDISDVLAVLKEKFPHSLHISIGVSMSGSMLLNLVSGRRGTVKPDYAITVNAPIDLHAGSQRLSEGFNRVYDLRFVHRLSQEIAKRQEAGLLSKNYTIPRFATVGEFDDIFTAVEFGFANRQDYYNQCSTWRHLHQVDVPTIMLTAADDPFIPVETYLDAQLSDSIILHIEPVGGHVGYYAGNSRKYGTNRWLDYFLEKSFRKILDGSLVFEKHSQKALIHAPGAHRSSESDKSRSGWNHLDRQ
jgi:predicted alpha/beta-fold hydrolase